MTFAYTTLVIVLLLLKYCIFLDVILSWFSLSGKNIRPLFLASILDPLYSWIKSRISTSIGPFDFTPIILLIALEIGVALIYGFSPETHTQILNLFSL